MVPGGLALSVPPGASRISQVIIPRWRHDRAVPYWSVEVVMDTPTAHRRRRTLCVSRAATAALRTLVLATYTAARARSTASFGGKNGAQARMAASAAAGAGERNRKNSRWRMW